MSCCIAQRLPVQVGVVSELLLSVLNTNVSPPAPACLAHKPLSADLGLQVHVYQVSPALTIFEKHTARSFAHLFGFNGARAGGVTCQGGSASNLTSLVIARDTLYPETKRLGTGSKGFVLFTSEHGHYSVEKAAVTCGLGSSSVQTVPVDADGRMIPSALRDLVIRAGADGKTPLYVNATAGTTVMGSYDPFEEISAICKEHGLWLHIDASWGGSVVFSSKLRHKLAGAYLADSLTVNPHKMMNVPITCSFLLGPDMDVFHRANTLPAGYLFHGPGDEVEADSAINGATNGATNGDAIPEVWDLADLTLQCGRRGDSLKLALSWIYFGAAGFERQIDGAFELAVYLAEAISQKEDFILLSTRPPPCLQVCFYYAPGGQLSGSAESNTKRTTAMAKKLISRGFMVDYAPGERGNFFRVVMNCQTLKRTVDGLIKALEEVGKEVV